MTLNCPHASRSKHLPVRGLARCGGWLAISLIVAGCGENGLYSSQEQGVNAASLDAPAETSGGNEPGCTLFHHANIFTGDPARPRADALAVCGEKVVFAGSMHELDGDRRRFKKVDLGGRTVVPGINDAHAHILGIPGTRLNDTSFVPGSGPDLDAVTALVRDGVATHPQGTWLIVMVGEAILADPNATRFALDPDSPNHPVILRSWTGHGTVINTNAMASLGISETESDPFGGRYSRSPGSNVINGVVQEYAEHSLNRKLFDRMSDAELVSVYRAYADQAVKVGYTSIQDIPLGLTRARAAKVLALADLPVRVRSMCFPLALDEACDTRWPEGISSKKDVLSGLKWITDGTPLERNAFLRAPYADEPDSRGVFNFSSTSLHDMMQRSFEGDPRSDQPIFHAIGDGSVDNVLDTAISFGPDAWRGRRFRIEHADLLFPDRFPDLRNLSATVVQNPLHFALPDLMLQRLGPDRSQNMQPLRSLLEQGIGLAFGTDSIGAVQTPWLDMSFAITHPTHPSEAITFEQALTAYTRGSAFVEFADDRKGTLSPGKLADFAVLSQDVFVAAPADLPATQSVLTIVGGEVVWDSGAVTR